MLDLDSLNSQQRQAVTALHGPLMILAGAGTGKTRVITARIAYMLQRGIPASQIVALSFTNKAAREMTERAKAMAGAAVADAWLGTFHSFCLKILRDFHREAGLPRRFGLAASADQVDLVRRALDEKRWSDHYDAAQLHQQISTAKNKLLLPQDIAHKGLELGYTDPSILAEIYELYERQLALHRVLDFDDCIFKSVLLLRQNAEVRAAARARHRYLMVDEYQDTNEAQLAILELLASDGHDVCVVGDDDQSIYSWRGAMYEVLGRFEELFPACTLIKLEQNYRCTNIILGAANTVIRNNIIRKDKTLWSASQDQTPLELVPCDNEEGEVKFVTEKAMSLVGGGLRPRDIAILYRANALAKGFELSLREASLPYRVYGGQSFYERKEVKDFLAYFKLVLDPESNLSLWRAINTPNRGIGMKTLEKIEAQAMARSLPPLQVLGHEETTGLGAAMSPCRQFYDMIKQLAALPRSSSADYEALAKAIIKQSGLESEIRQRTDDASARERKLRNLHSMPGWIARLAEDLLRDHGHIDAEAILDVFSLDQDRKADQDGSSDHISLMTVHAAKGLEFKAVFVVGLEEELFPHKNSIHDARSVDEERRLFYVALTRAKTRLFLSYALARTTGYRNVASRNPSRFLAEIPATAFQAAAGTPVMTAEQRAADKRQKTAARLAELRASLLADR